MLELCSYSSPYNSRPSTPMYVDPTTASKRFIAERMVSEHSHSPRHAVSCWFLWFTRASNWWSNNGRHVPTQSTGVCHRRMGLWSCLWTRAWSIAGRLCIPSQRLDMDDLGTGVVKRSVPCHDLLLLPRDKRKEREYCTPVLTAIHIDRCLDSPSQNVPLAKGDGS